MDLEETGVRSLTDQTLQERERETETERQRDREEQRGAEAKRDGVPGREQYDVCAVSQGHVRSHFSR